MENILPYTAISLICHCIELSVSSGFERSGLFSSGDIIFVMHASNSVKGTKRNALHQPTYVFQSPGLKDICSSEQQNINSTKEKPTGQDTRRQMQGPELGIIQSVAIQFVCQSFAWF
jgi:hypothetical protein